MSLQWEVSGIGIEVGLRYGSGCTDEAHGDGVLCTTAMITQGQLDIT